ALTITAGEPVQWFDEGLFEFGNGNVGGISYLVIVMIGAVVLTQFVLSKTRFGRNMYATGANYEVARYANIKVRFYKLMIFAVLGVAAAFAGIMLASRMGAGLGIYGEDLSMYVVAAVVVGGTSLSGGKGSAIQTLLGLLFMGILFNGLNMLSVSTYWQLFIRGIIVVIVIVIDRMMQMIKER
ncbi:MAG: ABC transporter permease, partial [Christensenella sp.]